MLIPSSYYSKKQMNKEKDDKTHFLDPSPYMEKMSVANTIVVSDTHLGSELSRVGELIDVLHSWTFERLILLGDIFDDLNFKRLRRIHWDFLSYIRQISKHKEVVWVEGNHDEGLVEVIPYLLGVKACKEYLWEYNGKRYLAIHGHQFDDFIINNGTITEIACRVYRLAQRIDTKGFYVSRFLKKKSKIYLRLSNKVANDAIRYGMSKGAHYVFCGHIHQAMSVTIDGIQYLNSGCWTDRPANYISIDKDGVELHELD
jgi:UDP-2,3-diacylglucosamine pyrophosphatase LpxH